MKSFETVYKELEELLIKQLPDYIKKVNIFHNDGIILKPFENTKLEEECLKLPSFKFKLEETEYTEKDRIIENSIYTVSLELKIPQEIKKETIIFWRYAEAIQKLFEELESEWVYQITEIKENKVFIRITVN